MQMMVLAFALALFLQTVPPSTLTTAQIQEAIAMGQSAKELKPARVGRRATLIKSAIAVEIGQVYTPKLRIATAARVARAAYKPFGEADLSPELAGDYWLIVLPPVKARDSSVRRTSVETIIALPKGSSDPTKAVRPLFTSTSMTALQNLFGAAWTEQTVFAAFPVEAFAPTMELVAIYAEEPEMGSGPLKREIRAVVVDPVDR